MGPRSSSVPREPARPRMAGGSAEKSPGGLTGFTSATAGGMATISKTGSRPNGRFWPNKSASGPAHRFSRGALEQRLSQIKQKLRRAFDALSENVVDDETYRTQTEAWRREKGKVEIELNGLERGENQEKWDRVLGAFKLAEVSETIWEAATPREKAKLAKTVCSNLALNDGTIEFSLAFPFDVLAKSKQNNDWRALADAYRTVSADPAWKPTRQGLLLEEVLAA